MVKKQRLRGRYSGYKEKLGGCPDIPGTTEYIHLLRQAIRDPENNSMPVCHDHLVGLATSIHQRRLSDTVIVLVQPGRDPSRAEQVGCYLCYRFRYPD
jgi:hypothetical protein